MTTDFANVMASFSPIVSSICFLYAFSLGCFRHSVYEDISMLDSARDILKYLVALYCSLRVGTFLGPTQLGPMKGLIHLVLIVCNVKMVIKSYHKYVAGKPFKRMNLTGKVYIVTGCNTGIGFETARALLDMGGTVVMACRSTGKAAEAQDELLSLTGVPRERIVMLKLDLCDFASVRAFVADFERLNLPLNCLINNAGTPSIRPPFLSHPPTRILTHLLTLMHNNAA